MNLLVSGNLNLTDEQKRILSSYSESVTYHQYENETVGDCERYEYVICNNLFKHNDISKFRNLRAVQLISTGIDESLKRYARENSVGLYNAKGVYSIPMAEHSVMQILNMCRNCRLSVKNQEKKIWEKNRTASELFGKTVCMLGFGDVGAEIAKRLEAFGCRIHIVNRTKIQCGYEYHPLSELEKAVSECDILIAAIALTEDTRKIIDKNVLKALPDGGMFVNVSRGGVVDEKALIDILKNETIYAALDVFENEPLDEKSPLWELENVYVTPHSSFIGDKNGERLFRLIENNLKNYREGR